ncbi:hypothetical protein [Mycetohabitans endofungorum]|uniref:hypothetical protein n=1 Tax=Mycetohabitans endofungorum TaxID=417203 RepID=UPI003BB1DC6D
MDKPTLRHTRVPYYAQWDSPEWMLPIVELGADLCEDRDWRRSGFPSPTTTRSRQSGCAA